MNYDLLDGLDSDARLTVTRMITSLQNPANIMADAAGGSASPAADVSAATVMSQFVNKWPTTAAGGGADGGAEPPVELGTDPASLRAKLTKDSLTTASIQRKLQAVPSHAAPAVKTAFEMQGDLASVLCGCQKMLETLVEDATLSDIQRNTYLNMLHAFAKTILKCNTANDKMQILHHYSYWCTADKPNPDIALEIFEGRADDLVQTNPAEDRTFARMSTLRRSESGGGARGGRNAANKRERDDKSSDGCPHCHSYRHHSKSACPFNNDSEYTARSKRQASDDKAKDRRQGTDKRRDDDRRDDDRRRR